MSIVSGDDYDASTLAIILCGVLVNCNKFEIYNPYQARIANLTDRATLGKIVDAIATTCSRLRDSYVEIQDDSPQPWTIGGTLSYVGLGSLAGRNPSVAAFSEDEARSKFMAL